ncbi:thioredoxin domain-containing protein 6-like [Portunus trituberculatus]|uniref:thioredoxin domain-containing protein 6-like n=1 Tax=Portunus trituberculatus TaxID=210409 RepID=UPI001E1CF577|nr:thioredoxin domain-containing protein 6-like [Portunus trituberculatus]
MAARKKAEAQQLLIELDSDRDWANACKRPGLLVVDVYSEWCGPCSSMTGHLRRIKLELGDEFLTLATANADRIELLEKFRGKAEPTWLILGAGKAMDVIHGADGPRLLNSIRRLLKVEVAAIKGNADRPVVLLDSLVKPEEVIEPDEDLDDVEGELHNLDDSEAASELSEAELQTGVLFILPHIISHDQAETFLSNVVAAGFEIVGHIQEELTQEDLHALLFPKEEEVKEEEEEEEDEKKEEEGEEDGEEKEGTEELLKERRERERERERAQQQTGEEGEGAAEEAEGEEGDTEEDLLHWEEELGHGPLYVLLLKVEEGSVVTAWHQVLGPPDLDKARVEEPESLVAQFGEEGHVVPAWLPKGRQLQERLSARFFPPPPDSSVPRLLLLPDTDHHEVLEKMGVAGVRVLAHTQATLSQEGLQSVPSLAASQTLMAAAGSVVLAVAVSGEGMEECAAEYSPLHLTTDSNSAKGEVELFFPDLLTPQEQEEEPQTQMQIEQSKEGDAA